MFQIKRRLMRRICEALAKRAEWGYDEDGDLTLRILGFHFTLYKCREPIVFSSKKNTRSLVAGEHFFPLDNERAYGVWEKTRLPITELVVIAHENKRHKESR